MLISSTPCHYFYQPTPLVVPGCFWDIGRKVQIVNPSPYLQTLKLTMPAMPAKPYFTIYHAPVYTLNTVYPFIVTTYAFLTGNPEHLWTIPQTRPQPASPAHTHQIQPVIDKAPSCVHRTSPGKKKTRAKQQLTAPPATRKDLKSPSRTTVNSSPTEREKKPLATQKVEPLVLIPEDLEARLMQAMRQQDHQLAFNLLRGQPVTRLVNHNGEGLLTMACKFRNYRVAKTLLEHNANPNQPSNDGYTPLHTACEIAAIDIVQLLLDYEAHHLAADNQSKETPLHLACKHNNPELIDTLLSHLVDKQQLNQINARSSIGGYTPLMLAAAFGHSKTVKTLLEYGADHELQAQAGKHRGKTAYDFAKADWRNFFTRRTLKIYMKRNP